MTRFIICMQHLPFSHSSRRVYWLISIIMCLADNAALAADPQTQAKSSCPEPITLPIGKPEDVVQQTLAFLIKEESIEKHPYWPGGQSGITIGIGWDAGQHSKKDLATEWARLDPADIARLQQTARVTGTEAAKLLPKVKDILIPPEVSLAVLESSIRLHLPLMERTFPGAEKLPAEAQVALISILFNRGDDMGQEPDWKTAKEVDRRWEMREFREDVRRRDMFAIYVHLNTMKRIWEGKGQRGLLIRRRRESALIRPFVDRQLKVDEERERLNCP